MNIPLVNLAAQYEEVQEEVQAGWRPVLERTAYILGEDVKAFEDEFADFSGVRHCIGVANGTDALELALRAVDVGPGDEVILPANTYIASALAVARAGATPVLVDVDEATQLMDVAAVEAALTEETKAIMPVHLFGQMADVAALVRLAERAGAVVVEDAAQCQGARRDGTPAGGHGLVAGTSFYPGKNLGAFGDAGAVLTRDDEVAERLRNLRNYGSDVKYHHPHVGFNSRLDSLQAVVLRAKLRRLARWNERRREIAGRYAELLGADERLTLPVTVGGNEHVWHLYVVRVHDRDRVLGRLHDAGVGAGIHYPVPIHLQGAFASLGHSRGDFPVTERLADSILSLPISPHVTDDEVQYVADRLIEAL